MRTREEAVRLIEKQLREEDFPYTKSGWHYGRVELRDLLDYIYESTPKNKEEIIK